MDLFTSISIHKILKCDDTKRNPHVKCISHYICHFIVKLLYIGKGKKRSGGAWNWRTKMHITMSYHYTHWTVCMYVFITYYFKTIIVKVNCKCWFYMNCNIDIWCNCMNFVNELGWIHMQDIWQQTSLLVLCSIQWKNLFPVILGCVNSILLHLTLTSVQYCTISKIYTWNILLLFKWSHFMYVILNFTFNEVL